MTDFGYERHPCFVYERHPCFVYDRHEIFIHHLFRKEKQEMMKSSLAIVFILVVLVVFTQGRALNDQKEVSYTSQSPLYPNKE